MKPLSSLISPLKTYLLRWVSMCFVIVILIFVISWLFPKKVPFIDSIRVSIQKMFFSSIGVVRYPHVSANDEGIQKHIRQKIQSTLLPWDIIFSYRAWFVTNDLILGERKHASVYLGNKDAVKNFIQKNNLSDRVDQSTFDQREKNDMIIIDSTERWVAIRSFKDLTYLDGILIVRAERSQAQREKMMTTLITQLGKPYNYDFDMQDTSSIYCAQLIHQGIATLKIYIPYTSLAGRAYLYPQDIVDYIFSSGLQKNEFSIVMTIKDIQGDAKIY